MPFAAPFAATAGVRLPTDADSIAYGEFGGIAAETGDCSDDFVTGMKGY